MLKDVNNPQFDPSDNNDDQRGKRTNKKYYRCKVDATDIETGDFQININKNVIDIDPFKLIEKLYLLHNNQDITKEEKEIELRKIVRKMSI